MHRARLFIHDPGGLGIFDLMAKALMDPGWASTRPAREQSSGLRPQIGDALAEPAAQVTARGGLLQRLERWFWTMQQRDIEAYLARASDSHDLETRIRMIERRGLPALY